jgi:tetratricopeptide (TPR) repeat protein
MTAMNRSRYRVRAVLSMACTAVIFAAAAAWACGPWLPNRILLESDQDLIRAPLGGFRAEIDRLLPRPPAPALPAPAAPPYDQTSKADLADLQDALRMSDLAPDRREPLIQTYAAVRTALAHYQQVLADAGDDASERPRAPNPGVPDGLPGEFADYLRGAICHHRGVPDGARAAWQAVLDRPEGERRYRSTWAAFMIGKSWLATDPAKAVEAFRRTRDLAAAPGMRDSLGLAATSVGWEARAELNRGRFEAAIALYLQQRAAGDPTAIPSLQRAARATLEAPPDALARVAADASSRSVVAAYLVARGGPCLPVPGPETAAAWLRAVETSGVTEAAGAGRLAWVAYQAGDLKTAARWVDRAPAEDAIADWLRARLLLRDGRLDDAAAALARACRAFPENESWGCLAFANDSWMSETSEFKPAHRTRGELALLRLQRGQFAESLDLLLRAQYWLDAAYVAERVLTADELKTYVDRAWPAPAGPGAARRYRDILRHAAGPVALALEIRYLLARRLTRLGRGAEARPYFPEDLRETLDTYVKGLGAGRDAARPATDRAVSLADAARLLRARGLELTATEGEPDWDAFGGHYDLGSTARLRESPEAPLAAPVSGAEKDRVAASAAEPDKRFHYRYRAADLAWEAAQLMPDNAPELATLLCEAGGWLKARDPKAADRFYKALVLRCGNTPQGQEAVRRRWFPRQGR